MNQKEISLLKEVGTIEKKVKEYACSIIKPNMHLLEIAEKIEAKIISLGAQPAFPVNLSKNEIAAHATPQLQDEEKASGLLKVDIGVQKEGYIADSAFSIDLENNEENKKLIETAEEALKKAVEITQWGTPIRIIGAVIESTIKEKGFHPISNLSGHAIDQYNLHAGITIPNFDNAQEKQLTEGVYAIEPFVTTGLGAVKDSKPSGIFRKTKSGNVRDQTAREVLKFIDNNYHTLPFCTRWIQKKFRSKAILALKRLEEAGIIHQYPMLIETGKGKVAQAEHTVIITEKEKIITTA